MTEDKTQLRERTKELEAFLDQFAMSDIEKYVVCKLAAEYARQIDNRMVIACTMLRTSQARNRELTGILLAIMLKSHEVAGGE